MIKRTTISLPVNVKNELLRAGTAFETQVDIIVKLLNVYHAKNVKEDENTESVRELIRAQMTSFENVTKLLKIFIAEARTRKKR